ncbi:endospore germination permease [Paenibacillus doosanensis]|uniref:Spore germination protein YndE n=1 Tax=Paenibacillus konkukensis TaxID=2020716 RepID=A0ABY4RUX3_9BACL|nr:MULTISPECIES: endospore germination permease [Paenibacillus]MCS7464707.1 endospore germination permease [Paenibacillus doosanensis]UQZ85853.1 Spore germination protein YndE [Paenibacillus konkukensis]
MLSNGKISIQQLAVLVILVTVGDSILILPSITTNAAKQDAWLSGIIGIAGGLIVLAIALYASSLKPEFTYVEFTRFLLGSWAGGAVSLLYLLYCLFNAAALLREIGDFITTEMIPETPERAVHFILILVLLYALVRGIEAVARAGEILLPWFGLFIVALIILLLPQAKFVKLLPIMGDGVAPVLRGAVYVASYPFAELSSLLMILPYVKRGKHMRKDFMLAALIGGICVVSVIFVSVVVLGSYITAHQVYPAYGLAKKISIGHFLERLEALLAIVWIISTFFKCTLFCYAFSWGTVQLFNLRSQRFLLIPFGLLLFGLAYCLSPNLTFYNELLEHHWLFWDLTMMLAIPLLLVSVYFARRPRLRGSSSR